MVGNIQVYQRDVETYEDEFGASQTCPPKVNMIRVINHLQYQGKFLEGKHLKFKVPRHPSRPYDDHLVIRVDTGADVNCINEISYQALFLEVKLSVCPHEIQNFGNSIADISILGQFCAYLQFKGKKYENTFIVTNANDCPNLLSHEATFRWVY